MAIEIVMPKLSDTMEEGKILKWFKKVGDKIDIGDIIAEVETDKADMEMEALDAGVLAEIRVQEGDSAPVGAVIAMLSEDGAGVAPVAPAAKRREQKKPAAGWLHAQLAKQAQEGGEKSATAGPATPQKQCRPSNPQTAGGKGVLGSWFIARAESARVTGVASSTELRRNDRRGERVLASPVVKRMAEEHGIDLRHLQAVVQVAASSNKMLKRIWRKLNRHAARAT